MRASAYLVAKRRGVLVWVKGARCCEVPLGMTAAADMSESCGWAEDWVPDAFGEAASGLGVFFDVGFCCGLLIGWSKSPDFGA